MDGPLDTERHTPVVLLWQPPVVEKKVEEAARVRQMRETSRTLMGSIGGLPVRRDQVRLFTSRVILFNFQVRLPNVDSPLTTEVNSRPGELANELDQFAEANFPVAVMQGG